MRRYSFYAVMKKFKGTVNVISSNPPAKMAMPDSQKYPWNLYLINNVDDIVVFLVFLFLNTGNSYMFSGSRNVFVPLEEKPQLKNKFLKL